MSHYAAPLRDMLFAMKEIGGLDAVLAQSDNEELGADVVEAILGEASKYASDVLAPINKQGDVQGCHWNQGIVTTADGFKEAYKGFCESGWNGMPARTEFGGQECRRCCRPRCWKCGRPRTWPSRCARC
jgi:alkylation response protein AidB-like acyl-CoA dehydrogenase